jgi:hypothetical protein
MNVKALTVAFALGAVMFYFIYVSFGLLMPVDFQPGAVAGAWGAWPPVFHTVTPLGFLIGLVETVAFGALLGLVIGAAHNFFHHRWAESH